MNIYRPLLFVLILVLSNVVLSGQNEDALTDSLSCTLNEIEIVAQRKLIKVTEGKLEYDVSGDKDAQTLSVIEILKKVPLVTVDGNDNIMVNGGSDFVVYKNGKPSGVFAKNLKEALGTMPAKLVKRIEVITDPDAQYEAEGVNGVINIVMDEGSVIDGVLGVARTEVVTTEIYSASANITMQKNAVTVNANYGFNWYGETQTNMSESDYWYKDTGNRLISRSKGYMPGGAHLAGLSASWEIDSLNLLSVSSDAQFMRFRYDNSGESTLFSPTGEIEKAYRENGNTPPYNTANMTVRVDFQHKSRLKGEMLSLSYLMNHSKSEIQSNVEYHDLMNNIAMDDDSYKSVNNTQGTEHTVQADYQRPLFNGSLINVGAKYISRDNPLYVENVYDNGNASVSDYRHYSHIVALYGQFNLDMKQWRAHAGLRYEYSCLGSDFDDVINTDFYRRLNDIVPTVGASVEFGEKNNLSINYGMRVKRPAISRLNPSESKSPAFVVKGNPALASANQHNITVGYMHFNRNLTLNTTLRYAMIDNAFVPVKTVTDGVICSTYENMGYYQAIVLQNYGQCNITESTQMTLNCGLYYQTAENKAMDLSLKRWRVSFYGQLSQQLPWKLLLSLSVNRFPGAEITPYAYQDGICYYSVGLQRSFMKDDCLTARITASDILCHKYRGASTHIVNGDYAGTSVTRYISPAVKLSLTYRFGSLNSKVKTTAKTIENNDLM